MKHLLFALLVACGSSSNPPAGPATTPAAATTPTTPTRPTATAAPAAPPVPALPVATNAAITAIDCTATDPAVEYCAHVKDPCCGDFQTWVCNNARYVDWFAEQCRK